jgi:tripartite-type tricarboxylate transporter receptor subunit TctC
MKKEPGIGRRALFGAVPAILATPAVRAQGGYPNRPVRVIVPFAAGGTTDSQMRALCEAASKRLGQPVIVENRSGAGGILGAQALANERSADGYLMAQMPSNVFRYPLTVARPPFDPETDFTYLIQVTGYVFGVAVRADSPFRSFHDLLAFAKANPGRFTYGTTGVGGTLHVTMEQIASERGIAFTHVPFRGTAEILPNVLNGTVEAIASSTDWLPLVKEGKLRALCTWGAERAAALPGVPTLREIGINLVQTGPYGLAGPKGMDRAVVTRIHDVFRDALQDPIHLGVLERYNMMVDYLDSEAYAASIPKLLDENRLVVEKLNLREAR